jgi:hypothetical protein
MYISYSQIAIFIKGLENPFNNWRDIDIVQGFAWRDQSVSFKTTETDYEYNVEVNKANDYNGPKKSSYIAISVPFEVTNKKLEIASITESFEIELELGSYQIVFEEGVDGEKKYCLITFIRGFSKEPKIINGNNKRLNGSLRMDAEAA